MIRNTNRNRSHEPDTRTPDRRAWSENSSRSKKQARIVNGTQFLNKNEKSRRDHELLLLLMRGEKEIAEGKGYTIESVMAEASDRLGTD